MAIETKWQYTIKVGRNVDTKGKTVEANPVVCWISGEDTNFKGYGATPYEAVLRTITALAESEFY